MTKTFHIKVSQRVTYDVAVEAGSAAEALRSVAACLENREDAPDLGRYPLREVGESASWFEPIQTDANGDEYSDPEFAAELARLIKDSIVDNVITAAENARALDRRNWPRRSPDE